MHAHLHQTIALLFVGWRRMFQVCSDNVKFGPLVSYTGGGRQQPGEPAKPVSQFRSRPRYA